MRADAERFLDALRPHTVVAVDSNILIYHLEGLASYVDLTMALLTRLAEGEFRLVVSTVSVGEILAGPHLARDEAKAARAAAEVASCSLCLRDRQTPKRVDTSFQATALGRSLDKAQPGGAFSF